MDPAGLDRLKPWLAEVVLAGAVYRKSGAGVESGVEKSVSAQAPARAARRALETPAEQIAVLDDTPIVDQIASLRDSMHEIETDPKAFEALVGAWMAGNVKAIDREALQPIRRASPGLFRRLVSDRNARWAKLLDQRLKGSGRSVVVVGVGHLVGAGSLPQRLRTLGYSVSGP